MKLKYLDLKLSGGISSSVCAGPYRLTTNSFTVGFVWPAFEKKKTGALEVLNESVAAKIDLLINIIKYVYNNEKALQF